jgi:hypothetical protein
MIIDQDPISHLPRFVIELPIFRGWCVVVFRPRLATLRVAASWASDWPAPRVARMAACDWRHAFAALGRSGMSRWLRRSCNWQLELVSLQASGSFALQLPPLLMP